MRFPLLACCAVSLYAQGVERVSASRVPIDRPYEPLTMKQRFSVYWRGAFSTSAGFQAFAPAWVDHARLRHREWGSGMEGYGARLGDRYGRFLVGRTFEHGAAAMLGYEPRYIPCQCTGTGSRIRHAMVKTFVTYNRQGKWVPNIPRFAAMTSSELIAPMWQPPRSYTVGDMSGRIGVRFGLNMATNVAKEFTPEWKKLIPFKKR